MIFFFPLRNKISYHKQLFTIKMMLWSFFIENKKFESLAICGGKKTARKEREVKKAKSSFPFKILGILPTAQNKVYRI